jgi:capsular polysaccharide biosynthesis protein
LIAKIAFSVPGLSKFNLRHRVRRFVDVCVPVNSFSDATSWHENWYLTLRSAETIHRKAPFSIRQSDVALFRQYIARYNEGEDFRLPEVFLACINKARIYSRDFLVMSSDKSCLYLESALSVNDVFEANGIFDIIRWPSPKAVPGEYVLLGCPWSDKNYFEWLLGNLPRLALIEQFPQLGSLPLIVPGKLKPYQKESLQMAGIPAERLVEFDGPYWQVDKLYFVQLLNPMGNPSPHTVSWLRDKFLGAAPASNSAAGRLLYITRRDASQRRVLNEEEITDFLQGIGFEIICPGDFSFAEQINMFRDANVVVGPHGAAFSNMVFAPAGATLIEFFGDNYMNGCYWALASICGHKHAVLTGPAQWLDYSISLADLKTTLHRVCGL